MFTHVVTRGRRYGAVDVISRLLLVMALVALPVLESSVWDTSVSAAASRRITLNRDRPPCSSAGPDL